MVDNNVENKIDIFEPRSENVTVVQTDSGAKDGQSKCLRCGATDIALNIESGKLRCNSCRHELELEKFEKSVTDLRGLDGTIIGSGASDINASAEDVLTLKCTSCGAEVVVDTSESLQSRCHWCRNTLSIKQQIPNGAVPDKVLPFTIKRDDAKTSIEKFVNDRSFFAHKKFKEEFCTENVMGVYLPYMVVDVNCEASFSGQGEILIRKYTSEDTTYYDADLYDVSRDFDLIVENLTIESNVEKLSHRSSERTNNIVNAIKPFDTENSVRWNANFIRGFTSQKRDTDIEDLSNLIDVKTVDIARHQVLKTIDKFDRGVSWTKQQVDIKGSQWKAAYLPIWLYSYQHNNVIHYVAANGRNLNTMGSIPINKWRLFMVSLIVQILGTIPGLHIIALDFDLNFTGLIFFASGPFFFWQIYQRYRNRKARYKHESAANSSAENLQSSENLLRRIRRTRRSSVQNRNDSAVNYKGGDSK